MDVRKIVAAAVLVVTLTAGIGLTGCGPSVGTVRVTGTVLADGEPVPGLTVQFSPPEGSRPSVGFTDESGRFVLRYNKDIVGVLPGKQQVTFSWYAEQPGQKPTPGQALVLARHDEAGGRPLDLMIEGPQDNLVIAIDSDDNTADSAR